MAYTYAFPNSTSGIDSLLIELSTGINFFVPLLLTFVYFFVLLGGFRAQSRRTGQGDFAQWNLLASLVVLMITLLLTTTAGMTNILVLGVVIALNILNAVWFFFSRGRFE